MRPIKQLNLTDPVKILRTAKRRVSQKNRWNPSGMYARNANQQIVSACAYGHVMLASADNERDAVSPAIWYLERALPHQNRVGISSGVGPYNDTEGRTIEEIRSLFDKAIEIAKQESKVKE